MIPLKPVKQQADLPLTYHVTVVKDPGKGARVLNVVLTTMQGDEVLARRVIYSTEDKQDALDEVNRKATRCWYFDDHSDWETL